jgi:DNA helicase-2/ATP-dependent DNA helicase PcrA
VLNPQQQKAVDYQDGFGFVTAVPGSGKTRVLSERTVKMIKKGVEPERILCITFTNKAAKEMKERIEKRVGEDISKRLWVSTFHSMGAKILRQEVDRVPFYNKSFTIIDDGDQHSIMEKCAGELGFDAKKRGNPNGIDLKNIVYAINAKKDKLQNQASFAEDHDEETVKLANAYKEYLLKTNCMDFGDLIYITYLLFKKRASVLEKYSKRFKYIMVDECQDLNHCQYELVKQLCSYHNNLVLIGDCDQSIYRFRQADPQNVFKYMKEKKVDMLPLSLNYRSSKTIVRCAEAVIKNNASRVSENIETGNKEGHPVHMILTDAGSNEQELVAKEIKELCSGKGFNYSDIAILYRVNALSRGFEQSLRMSNIPCKVIGGRSYFDLEIVKTCISYLQFYENPNNVLAFYKIANKPRRAIADEMVKRIEEYSFEHNCDIIHALNNINDIDIESFGAKRKQSVNKLRESLEKEENDSVYETAVRIFSKSGYEDYIQVIDDKAKDKASSGKSSPMQIYDSFMTMLAEWDENVGTGLGKFLEYINLQSGPDEVDESNSVKLMTMHSSKGLEFPVVFLVCVEEDNHPHKFSKETGDLEDIEEERRLFYVGMTRAKKRLYATFVNSRMTYGKYERRIPSRFLTEMENGGARLVNKCGEKKWQGR